MIEKIKFTFRIIATFFKSPIVTDYFKENESKYKIKITDKYKLKERYKLNDLQIINLTCGCPVPQFTLCDFHGYSSSEDVFKTACIFKVKGKRIASFERTIDFRNMEIINDKMIVNDEGKGISTNAFLNQLIQAYALGFKNLSMQAAGGEEYKAQGKNFFQGYYHWAKYGYILDEDDELKLQVWLKKNKRNEKNLWEVCMNDKSYKLWKETGFHWFGFFEIYQNSPSFYKLNRYLISKGINVSSCNLPL